MATAPSPELRPPAAMTPTAAPSPAVQWLILAGGLVAAIGWVLLGQHLGGKITIASAGPALTVYYALLFLPLIALALGLGMAGRLRVVRAGTSPLRWAAIGGLLGLGGLATTLAYAWLNGGVLKGPAAGTGTALLLLGLGLTLVQVFAEEVLFRGWLQPALIVRTGAMPGVLLGALLFGAFHLTAGVREPLSLLNLGLGGVWFGLLALRSGGIVASLAAHFCWNALEDLGFGLVPNPGTGELGAVANLDLTGAPLWGATAEGLNASIGTTVVLVALILPLVLSARRTPVPAR